MSAFIRTNRGISPTDPAFIPQDVLNQQEADTAWLHQDYDEGQSMTGPKPPAKARITEDYRKIEMKHLLESFLRGYSGGTEEKPCGINARLKDLPKTVYDELYGIPDEEKRAGMRYLIGQIVSAKHGYPRADAKKDLQRYAGLKPSEAEYELSWLQDECYQKQH